MARPRKPLVAQNEVLARTLARQSKSQIAREMGIDRETVTRIQECHNLPQLLADSRQFIVENVIPDAIRSLHAQIVDRDAPGDGDLAARLLENSGVLNGGNAPSYTIEGDVHLQQALALLPPVPNNRNARGDTAPLPTITVEPLAGANNSSLTALTVEAEPVPTAAQPKRAAHPPDCGCEDCRCSECGRRRNPRDAAGRVELFDRCVCVPRSALATQR